MHKQKAQLLSSSIAHSALVFVRPENHVLNNIMQARIFVDDGDVTDVTDVDSPNVIRKYLAHPEADQQ